MSSKFLDDLPREIRTQIFSYVLAPTGRIIIKRTSGIPTKAIIHSYPALFPGAEISLSLLQTCRQIYDEAKGVLWSDNILCLPFSKSIWDAEVEDAMFLRNYPYLSRNVRILELRLTPDSIDSVKVDRFLQQLGEWKSVVLREVWFTMSGMGTMSMFGETVWRYILHIRLDAPLPDILSLAGNKETGYLRHMCRRLNIELGIRHTSNEARRVWFENHHPADCEDTLKDLHQCLGGDVYIDGALCYKDGVRLRETFAAWEAESRND
jgi:hypothetical protein